MPSLVIRGVKINASILLRTCLCCRIHSGALGGVLHSLNPNDQVMFQKYYQAAVSSQRRTQPSSRSSSASSSTSSHAKAAPKFVTNKRARSDEDMVTDAFTFAMEGNGVAGPADDYVPSSTAAQQLHFFR